MDFLLILLNLLTKVCEREAKSRFGVSAAGCHTASRSAFRKYHRLMILLPWHLVLSSGDRIVDLDKPLMPNGLARDHRGDVYRAFGH